MLQMGIQPENERKNDMRRPVFPGTDPFSLFSRFAYILFVIHRDKLKIQSHVGSAVLTLIKIRCFIQMYTKKVLGVLHRLLASGPANIL